MSQSAEIDIGLHAKQGVALQTEGTEVLYGGAAGGGKSHLMRAVAVLWCASIPGLQVYLFRRIREDLIKNHVEGPKGLRALLAPWVQAKLVTLTEDEIRFWNGSKIYLCHCKDEKDRFKYLGAEIHVLLIDELTTFTEVIYRFLRNRVRAVGLNLTDEYKGKFPRILASSNPGNVGHQWVKTAFLDGAEPYEVYKQPAREGGMLRQFIPALLEDNPSMASDDPGYEDRLEGLGSDALVKAMRYGDWNVVEGAFFDCWNENQHVLRPFAIPEDWLRFRSMDWGSAKPFSIGWWAVVSDDFWAESKHGNTVLLPRGAIVRYREWYGVKRNNGQLEANVGLKLTVEEVAEGIKEREQGEDIAYGVADPAMWQEDGGPSMNERMAKCGVYWRKADNKRVAGHGQIGGWDQMRQRMKATMLATFSTCVDSIRTIPVLQHDDKRPEDLDTEAEDHCFAAGTLVDTHIGPVPIEELSPDRHAVWSGGKWRREYRQRMTRGHADVVRLRFDHGVEITCTPDHRFMDCSGEWRYARDLQGVEVSCDLLLSARRSKSLTARAITAAGRISSGAVAASIAWFGSGITAPSQRARISTIRMETGRTTRPTTSNALTRKNTLAEGMAVTVQNVASTVFPRPAALLPSGTEASRAGNGTRSITIGTSAPSWKSGCRRVARNVAANIAFLLRRLSRVSTVAVPVRPVRCVSVEDAGKAPVYCIDEPDTHAFTIEGGLIVHNCADEWRYACMSRPWVAKKLEEEKPRDRYDRLFEEDEEESWRTV